jgi:hypothetical protein
MSDLPDEMEEALKNYYSLFAITVAGLYKVIKRDLGEKGIEVMSRALREIGAHWGEMFPEYYTIRGKGAKSFADSFLGNIRYYGFKADILPGASEKKAVVRIHFCPLHDICKDYYPDMCCNTNEPNFDVGTSSWVNPKLKLRIKEKIPNGDPYCDYEFYVEE